jgi:hypothetical protein
MWGFNSGAENLLQLQVKSTREAAVYHVKVKMPYNL